MMETKPKFTPNRDLKRMDQVRQVLRYHHYALNTEKTYCKWILRYIRYFGAHRHPSEMGAKEVETFLSHLATTDKVSAATQRQARDSIVFLYKKAARIAECACRRPLLKNLRRNWRPCGAFTLQTLPKGSARPGCRKALQNRSVQALAI